MANGIQKNRKPWKPPQWLLEASKKRSGAPVPPVDQAFLDKLQLVRDDPEEVERQAREIAIRTGRNPDAFARMMAETRKSVSQAHVAQQSKQARAEEDLRASTEAPVQGSQPIQMESTTEQTAVPSPIINTSTSPEQREHDPSQGNGIAVQATSPDVPFSLRTQRRVATNVPITGPAQIHVRDARREKSDSAMSRSEYSRRASGARSNAPSMVLDEHTVSESSTSGAVREARIAAAAATPTDPISGSTSYRYPTRSAMPSWYTSISPNAQGLTQLDRKRPQELAAIDALKDCIRRCEQTLAESELNREYNKLRDHVHKAEIKLNMDKYRVKKTRILTENGLPRIFKEDAKFPWDLKADAWYLYERWMNEDFEQNILRGIVTVKGKDRNGDRLDRAYTSKHPRDPKFFGDEGVVLGQWWPSQLCTVRDGVHGSAQGGRSPPTLGKKSTNLPAGIYGDKERGAYSIVLSSGGYQDQDDGDTIEYSGTDGKEFKATDATLSMIKSAELGNYIRVIRSSQLPLKNKYRPSCGLRYDGLYQIKSYKELDKQKRSCRFRLERVPGQEPVRFAGVTKRPTVFEEEAYDRCKGRI